MKNILISVNRENDAEEYRNSVKFCGGNPKIKHCPQNETDFDGLILGGGVDISPCLYGEKVDGAVNMDPLRDECEYKLLEYCIKTNKPVLGICRGIQFINAFFGGTLTQHLPNYKHHRGENFSDVYHTEKNVKGSFMYDLYGENMVVNSIHHQAIKKLAPDLIPIQYSDDGLVEGVMHKTLPIIAVQWHPERICDISPLFESAKKAGVCSSAPLFRYFLNMVN